MSETPPRPRKVDPIIAFAVLFFLLAVGFALVPAFSHGLENLASMMLLTGLAGVCCIGLFVLRGPADAPAESEAGTEAFLTAL